jgi:hypothetical protein
MLTTLTAGRHEAGRTVGLVAAWGAHPRSVGGLADPQTQNANLYQQIESGVGWHAGHQVRTSQKPSTAGHKSFGSYDVDKCRSQCLVGELIGGIIIGLYRSNRLIRSRMMPGPKPPAIKLTAILHKILEQIARRYTNSYYLVLRAKIILIHFFHLLLLDAYLGVD